MMEVEITNHLPPKPYVFEGEPALQDVPFNHPHTLKIYELIASAKSKEAIANIAKAIFEGFPQLLALSASESSAKSVCAKIVSRGQTIVECLNCRMDESCIICLNCFKNGNHEGHKVLYKKAYGGCCDCGDAEAWNPKGFCKQHSGEVQDIQIDPKDVSAFSSVMQDLFYLYIRLKLKKENQNIQNVALISLINVFQLIIEKGPKGIKLLALFLQSRIPLSLKYNEQLQKQSVISHMFIWRLVGRDLKFWEPAFINMFPYYEFKKVLLATYIECFPHLYLNEESCMAGQSLSCQILTSYKLVEDYIDSPNSQPIGYNIKGIMDPEHMNYLSSMLCSDLEKIIKLQQPVPEKYIRFQSQKGVNILFASQDIVVNDMKKQKLNVETINKKSQEDVKGKKKKKKKKMMSQEEENPAFFNPILYMIRNIKQIFNEYTSLQLLSALLHVVSRDRLSLTKMLKDLAKLIQTTPQQLVIFRAYDRAFALTLFTLCGYNLDRLLQFQFRRELMELLDKDQEGFEVWLKMVEQRMLSTYFFYCHVLCNQERGYHSSFFNYIYLYRSKDNFLISIDTLQLKMMALLSRTKTVLDFRKLLRFQDLDEEKWSIFILNTLLQELPLLYIGNFSQIYTSHYQITQKDKVEVRKDVIGYLAKFIVGEGNSITLERAVQFSRAFLFDKIEFLKKCLLQCCSYIKQKKIFQLKPQFREEKPFNFKDFQLRLKDDRLSNKNTEQTRPELTYPLINGYNRVIFSHYWNDQNIESIKQVMMDLYQDVVNTQVHDNIIELATIICKFCSSLRTFASLEQQAFVDEILLRTAFSSDIKQKLTQFKSLIGEEQVQTDMKLKQKKQLLLMKKMKKMEGLKKRQEENMSTIRQVHNIQQQIHEAEQFCAICRNKDSKKHQLVYLVNLNIRNLEKLANLGSGVQTASFTTCYHIFDSKCLEKECKNVYEANLKCPVCRKAGNIFFPAYLLEDQESSSPYVKACLERITQVMMTIHSYLQIDPIEELFKSLYHFALLSLFDPEYVRKSRLKLYRVILQMILHSDIQRGVPELIEKLTSNEWNLNPKLLRKDKVSIINVKAGGEDFFAGVSDESDDDQDDSLIMVEYQSKKATQIKKADTKRKGKKSEVSAIFRFVALRILKQIYQSEKQEGGSKVQQMKNENSQQGLNEQNKLMSEQHPSLLKGNLRGLLNSQILPEVPNEVQLIINELIGSQKSLEHSLSKPLELQLTKLPETFHWDMSKNECDLCKQPCHDMFSCLLCPWKGCLNCKSGGVNKHFPATHGETSAFMRVSDGVAYIIATKMIKKVGCLYLNEWGEPLRLKYDWNSYCLQADVLQKIRNLLLRDE